MCDGIVDPFTITWDFLRSKYDITNNHALRTLFKRTAILQYWDYNFQGGKSSYLCQIDRNAFRELFDERCMDINCIATTEGLQIAFNLFTARYNIAKMVLDKIGCPRLIIHLQTPVPPTRGWRTSFAHKIGIKICSPQTLELARRCFCDPETRE
jgi:hypothetical protein